MPGPTSTTIGDRYSSYFAQRVSSTTPYGVDRVPLPYYMREIHLDAAGLSWDPQPDLLNTSACWAVDTDWCRGDGTTMDVVQNKARDRFMSKVHGDVQGLVNLAEYRQTWDTLASLLQALRRPATALDNAISAYQRTARGGSNALTQRGLQDMGSAWLAWHFGVEPLIKDIFAAAEILQAGPIPKHRVVGSAKGANAYNFEGTGYNNWTINEAYQLRSRIGAFIEVTNPNLHLANSLGLLNPAAVAWELVPWSFVLDWFGSFGAWLNALSDEFGISLTNVYRTSSCHAKGDETFTPGKNSGSPGAPMTTSCHVFRINREVGLPGVNVGFIKTAPWSLTRIGTAFALVLQQLPRPR